MLSDIIHSFYLIWVDFPFFQLLVFLCFFDLELIIFISFFSFLKRVWQQHNLLGVPVYEFDDSEA